MERHQFFVNCRYNTDYYPCLKIDCCNMNTDTKHRRRNRWKLGLLPPPLLFFSNLYINITNDLFVLFFFACQDFLSVYPSPPSPLSISSRRHCQRCWNKNTVQWKLSHIVEFWWRSWCCLVPFPPSNISPGKMTIQQNYYFLREPPWKAGYIVTFSYFYSQVTPARV